MWLYPSHPATPCGREKDRVWFKLGFSQLLYERLGPCLPTPIGIFERIMRRLLPTMAEPDDRTKQSGLPHAPADPAGNRGKIRGAFAGCATGLLRLCAAKRPRCGSGFIRLPTAHDGGWTRAAGRCLFRRCAGISEAAFWVWKPRKRFPMDGCPAWRSYHALGALRVQGRVRQRPNIRPISSSFAGAVCRRSAWFRR